MDAIAAPFVAGLLRKASLSAVVETTCAQSNRHMKIELDSDVCFNKIDSEAHPLILVPLVDVNDPGESNIINIF